MRLFSFKLGYFATLFVLKINTSHEKIKNNIVRSSNSFFNAIFCFLRIRRKRTQSIG